jgi:AmmeMemoRadiSam system protein B/AmmeMemoRadiSam system protein A
MSFPAHADKNVKKPNVSGQFYDSDPKRLNAHLDQLFKEARNDAFDHPVEIIIAPHAGYIYSGAVAAHSFKAVSARSYKTIVIIAPSHFVGFDGISVWEEGAFETPLGQVRVDSAFTRRLIGADANIYFKKEAFDREHALEVEIPFLQKTFKDFEIVPVVMGQPSMETMQSFARTLADVTGDRHDVLIVVSTDLSHYHPDAVARQMDARTIQAIERMDIAALIEGHQSGAMESCGFIPVLNALLYAKEKGLNRTQVITYANSGDTSGDKSRVVGYVSIAIFAQPENGKGKIGELSLEQKKALFEIAEKTIHEYVRTGKIRQMQVTDPRLKIEEGAFVTLFKKGQLRGCIGNVLGQGPLYDTVKEMAVAAASRDPRFQPVKAEELDEIDIEVSVLSKPWQIKSVDEITLGEHGVIVSRGFRNGLFLPEVATDWGFTKEEFLSRLCSEKAGLPADCWKDPKTKIEIFKTTKFTKDDLK